MWSSQERTKVSLETRTYADQVLSRKLETILDKQEPQSSSSASLLNSLEVQEDSCKFKWQAFENERQARESCNIKQLNIIRPDPYQ